MRFHSFRSSMLSYVYTQSLMGRSAKAAQSDTSCLRIHVCSHMRGVLYMIIMRNMLCRFKESSTQERLGLKVSSKSLVRHPNGNPNGNPNHFAGSLRALPAHSGLRRLIQAPCRLIQDSGSGSGLDSASCSGSASGAGFPSGCLRFVVFQRREMYLA